MGFVSRFEFATANQIVFGPGTARDIPTLAAAWGKRVLLITRQDADAATWLVEALQAQGMTVISFVVPGEPDVALVETGVNLARAQACEWVVGLGGGSAIDAGKAIAALCTNPGQPLDYLEVIGGGQALTVPPLPYLAVPTTAGTGAEVTRNAVLASKAHQVKVSLRSPLMLPRLAVVDPELTLSLPPAVTAATGLDALTQVLEPFVSKQANPITDALCREGLQRASESLRRVYDEPDNLAARTDMALVSLLGGLALANARLGAVHGFAGPIGGMFDAPHGAVCARLLPLVMEANVRALQAEAPDHPALMRYDQLSRWLTGYTDAGAAEGIAWVADLVAALGVPSLGAYGLTAAAVPDVVAKAQVSSSMKGNPIALRDEVLHEILQAAL